MIAQHVFKKASPRLKKLMHRCWIGLAIGLVILAVVFTLFRALTPWVKQYKNQIETQLSSTLGQTVIVQDIDTSWYWFVPVLRLDHVVFVDSQQHRLSVNQVMVGMNLWTSLWHWQIEPSMLYVDDVHLKIKQTAQGWLVKGLESPNSSTASAAQSASTILGVLFSQHKIIIKHVSADVELQNGMTLPLQGLNLKMTQRVGHYHIYGNAKLSQKPETIVAVIADLQLDPNQVEKVSGQVYLSVKNVNLSQWKTFFPESVYKLTRGECNVETWLTLRQGEVFNVQSIVQLANLNWLEPGRAKPRKMPMLHANVGWKRLADGWRATADRVVLRMNGMDWPENQLMVAYKSSSHTYKMYLKTLSIDQIAKVDFAWPESVKHLLALQPTGMLHDIQLAWQDGDLNYVLAQFSQLGWQATVTVPALDHLFGAVYWQPHEGRLEIDGEHTTLTPLHHLEPVTFDVFNAAFDWKELSQGLRVSMERLVLSHPHLVLSATGAIDNPMGDDANVRLGVDFAAKSAQFWLPYIPSEGLKPKLDHWLKHDITRVGHASGHLDLSGPLAEFPFDHQEGTFSINAHVNGVDLLITPDWPINQDMNADIHVNNRTLTADVDQANLSGVLIHDVNLSVPDIGLGREVFLLHGKIVAPSTQVKEYVFHSPLKQRLARWRGLDIDGVLGLDLQLEVPLYPESDDVLAVGSLSFDDNKVSISVIDNPAQFEKVTGQLHFNEYGLTSGRLEGALIGYPFMIHVQPLAGPKAGTELRFEGEITLDYLNHLIHVPVLSLMRGQMIVTGLWTVYPNDADLDRLYLNSSLAGVAINLPKPLGKSMLDIMPLTVDVAFHPKHLINMHMNYGQDLKGKIQLRQTAKKGWMETGEIHLGAGTIQNPNPNGLDITGSLEHVDSEEWRRIITDWPKTAPSSVSVWDNIRDINLAVGQTVVLGQAYKDVRFKGHQTGKNNWSGSFAQQQFSGTFQYNKTANTFSTHLDHLYWEPATEKQPSQSAKWDIHPDSAPSIDVLIDNLKYKGIDIGKITVKTISKPNDWVLKEGTVQTSEYQLFMTGDWKVADQKNKSTMKMTVRLNNLAKSLERWKITSAVDAHFGEANIEGNWNAPFYDFSLKHMIGQMHLVLKDGRISHLDRQTEEKLGLGKLLSILSLQTIPRRLKLDFSDLSEKGYSFDVFKGNFQINQGIMTTDDSYIDGPVAYARMQGDLDLVNHLYDVDLRISPYIGASLPVVATIAGGVAGPVGPVAGVATWVALKIINQGMQKINAYTYKISGPWTNPVVQQVSIVKSAH